MQKKLLLAFDDPGGGLAVSSLISRLSTEGNIKLEIYSGKLSERFLEKDKINFNKLESHISMEEAEKIMDETSPDMIITGTGGGNAEQHIRNAANERNIKSVVILDFWKDYSRRWLYASYSIEEMKDIICVMDELTKEEMAEEKFPSQKIIVTGHPYLDKLFNHSCLPDETDEIDEIDEKPASVFKHFDTANNFLFLSQPLHIIGIKDYKVHPLKIVAEALKKVSEEKDAVLSLTIRLHPSEEKSTEIINLINSHNSHNTVKLEIKFADRDKSLEELLIESGVVIGYNTIAMFEAVSMNKRTISLNIVPVRNSLSLAMRNAGIEIVNADENEIHRLIMNGNPNEINASHYTFQGGIENSVRVILNELNLN